MTADLERKNISISLGNYDRLSKLGNVNESFNDVVTRILDFYEEANNSNARDERLSS